MTETSVVVLRRSPSRGSPPSSLLESEEALKDTAIILLKAAFKSYKDATAAEKIRLLQKKYIEIITMLGKNLNEISKIIKKSPYPEENFTTYEVLEGQSEYYYLIKKQRVLIYAQQRLCNIYRIFINIIYTEISSREFDSRYHWKLKYDLNIDIYNNFIILIPIYLSECNNLLLKNIIKIANEVYKYVNTFRETLFKTDVLIQKYKNKESITLDKDLQKYIKLYNLFIKAKKSIFSELELFIKRSWSWKTYYYVESFYFHTYETNFIKNKSDVIEEGFKTHKTTIVKILNSIKKFFTEDSKERKNLDNYINTFSSILTDDKITDYAPESSLKPLSPISSDKDIGLADIISAFM